MIHYSFMRLVRFIVLFSLAGMVQAEPDQQPDIGTNKEVWGALDVVWKIRESKRWGDRLDAKELAAVALILDSSDDSMMRYGAAFFTPQIFQHLFKGATASANKIRVVSQNEAYAGFDRRAQSIEISVGLLQAMYWTQFAIEEARENPANKPSLANFLLSLSRNNFQRTPLSASSVIRLTEFATGKPWHPDIKLINQIDRRVTSSLIGALVYIIAHEGCHAQLGHIPTSDRKLSISQEWAADLCSIEKIGTAFSDEFNPYLALGVLTLFGMDDQGGVKKSTTHPGALCRMSWMMYNNGANGAKSAARSIELLPLLVDLAKFPLLTEQQLADLPNEYRHPNFLAVRRVADYCGGYEIINPRAFDAK